MYHQNGDFGLVKVKSHSFIKEDNLFLFANCGWHKCNDRYKIQRNKGISSIIFVTVSGEGTIEIDDKKYKLKKNTVAFVPKSKNVSYYTPKGGLWEFYWLHPYGDMCDRILSEIEKQDIYINKTSAIKSYSDIIESILKISDNRGIKYDAEISMKVSEFIHLTFMDLMNKDEEQSLSERAMEYLSCRKSEDISIESCAKELFVSPAHLIRVFKKETGQTPYKFLMNERLNEAKTLLNLSTLTEKEVAALTGFSSSAHLIKAYKNKYGKTPRSNN